MTGLMTGCMNSISTNVYIDKLDDIVKKYNNKYHRAIKMKPVDLKWRIYIHSNKKLMIKILNLKLVILLEYQDIKMLLLKVMLLFGVKKFFLLQKLKILSCGYLLLVILKTRRNCWNVLRKKLPNRKQKRV